MKKGKRSYVMTARSDKTEATRERIRQSAIELYRERALDDFTLDEVAARAETTVQTVLRAFTSKDNLIVEAIAALSPQASPLKPSEPGDVTAAVTVIFDLYESIGDLVLQRLADERRLPALKPGLDLGRSIHRDWVKTTFAPQLRRQAGTPRIQLFNSLVVATDVYVWKLLRRDQALNRAAAEAVVRDLINGVLPER